MLGLDLLLDLGKVSHLHPSALLGGRPHVNPRFSAGLVELLVHISHVEGKQVELLIPLCTVS